MSNRMFQNLIDELRKTVGRTVGLLDENGNCILCSDQNRVGEYHGVTSSGSPADAFVKGAYTYKTFTTQGGAGGTLFIEGDDAQAGKFASVLAVVFPQIKQFYDEKYDRANFIKNILLDNILPGDIYMKASEMHFATDAHHVVLLIRSDVHNDVSVYNVLQQFFPEKNKDFIITLNETDIALVKEVKRDSGSADYEKLARSIVDTLSGEFYIHSEIGIGTQVEGIKGIARSFKEAQISLEVGKVFDTERSIISYDNLGIARLIYQLPTTLCDTFLREVFKRGSIDSLDQETLFTIQKFFENNLNVSETSRKLFVHRNTLVYRLEKIKKLTGLDLREFDHAIVFKIALMVKKYLSANPTKY